MSDLVQHLAVPFQYEYMRQAIWVSMMIGGVCGFLSAFVTLKGWSLMGDALSHAVVPGVAVAYILGLPFAVGAFIAGLLAAWTMAFVRSKSRIREDATIGVVFTTFFAIGLVLISLFPAGVDLKVILYGNILGIASSDILQVVAISGVTLMILALKWKDLMLFCFDPNQARTLGLKAKFLHVLLLALLAAMSVAALQAVGAILVIAMLVTPGATAYLLTDRFGKMMWISAGLGASTSLVGAYSSYYINGATGGCIVSLQSIVFVIVFFASSKHGYIAARRRVRAEQPGTP